MFRFYEQKTLLAEMKGFDKKSIHLTVLHCVIIAIITIIKVQSFTLQD